MTQGLTGIRSLWHDPWMEVDASLGLSWIYQIYMKRTYSLDLFHMEPQLLANTYTIPQTLYAELPLFATRFAACTGGIRVPLMWSGLI